MDLAEVFDRATDGIESPYLARAALDGAQALRVRRRVALGAALAVVAVVGTTAVVAHQQGDGQSGPTLTPSITPRPTEPTQPPSTDDPTVATPEWGTQPLWDPRKVDDLPGAPDGTVPALPLVIDPPGDAAPLADAPVQAAVVAVEQPSTIELLTSSGEWRSVPSPGRHPRFVLSPLGTGLLVAEYGKSTPVLLHDLATGASREIAYPDGYQPWDFTGWAWVDEDTLLLDDGSGGWLIDAATGAATRVPYPSAGPWTLDPEGAVVEAEDWGSPSVLTDWAGGQAREVSMRATGRLSGIAADADTVVGTSYDGHPFSVIVADRDTLTPQAVLPLGDHEANYSNWGLRVLALEDDGTVLLSVAKIGGNVEGFRVVAWDPRSGDLSLVSVQLTGVDESVAFADGLLRRTDP